MLGVRNWKTSLAGIGMLLTAVSHAASNNWTFDASVVGMIVTGLGLLTAKDFNVTGTGSGN